MIATVGPCLPVDLLAATGQLYGPVKWQLDQPTPRADTWLESRFPRWARSILENWAEGLLDHLEAVLFSRGDDVTQRLYYYICELQRRGIVGGPRPLIFDVAKIPRAASEAHTISSVRTLTADLSVDDAALAAGIAAMNEQRTLTSPARTSRACLLPGTLPPQDLLHDAVRDAGFHPVGHTLYESWTDLGPLVDEDADPAAAIGRQVHARSNGGRGFGDIVTEVANQATTTGAAAAVLWYTEEDEARIWQLPRIRSALADMNIPVHVMTRRDERASDDAPNEIKAFLRGLTL